MVTILKLVMLCQEIEDRELELMTLEQLRERSESALLQLLATQPERLAELLRSQGYAVTITTLSNSEQC